MKTLNKKTWQYEKHGIDGEVELFGVNIFDYKWQECYKGIYRKLSSYRFLC